MEVHATGKDVRTGKTLERELCTVGTASDRLHPWRNVTFLHGFQHDINHVHVRINLLFHVIILVLDLCRHRSLSVFLVHLIGTDLHESFAVLERIPVVVADDIAQLGILGTCLHARDMIETLVAFRLLRNLIGRQHHDELGSQSAGIDHLALGIARMHAHALNQDLRTGSVEVLELQLT